MLYLFIASIVSALLLTLYAAFSDFRTYKIPNWISLLLISIYPVAVLSSPMELDWTGGLISGGSVLFIGFILFAFKIIGAGDVKLASVIGLWAGTGLISIFLFTTALAGGVIVSVMFAGAVLRNRGSGGSFSISLQETLGEKTPVPYGVAIAIGSSFVFYHYASLSGALQ